MNENLPNHAFSDNGLWLVGRIYGADHLPYEISLRDVEADANWAEAMLGRIGIGAGDTVLFGYHSSQHAQWWPWLKALHRRHGAYAPAMPSPYDGPRWGMYMRRFDLRAAFGINNNVLQALDSAGEDTRKLMGKSGTLIAEVDAIPLLREWGLKPWRLINLGPTMALQPWGEEGALYNAAEWLLESVDGSIVISSQKGRRCVIERLATGLRGSIVHNERGEMRLQLAD
ncbi:conserved hypothetical protein [Ricinus communis]|uniref:AMP-dependent synthetase/ligase domain-containing protein n=1 Tax=Ricinus communis TaxID=3988 RepID=B9T9E7_RICCO|nr:conserved hypothetical protein [Ricinus communis]